MRVHVWGRDWKLGSLSPGWTEWSETVLNRFRHSVKLDGKKERREQSSSYLRLQHSRCPAPTHRGQRRNREAGQVNSGKTVSVQQLSFTFQSEGHHDVTPRNTSNQHGDTFTPIHPRFVRWHVPKYMYKYDGKWRKKKVFLFLYVVFPPMVSGRLFFFCKNKFLSNVLSNLIFSNFNPFMKRSKKKQQQQWRVFADASKLFFPFCVWWHCYRFSFFFYTLTEGWKYFTQDIHTYFALNAALNQKYLSSPFTSDFHYTKLPNSMKTQMLSIGFINLY